MREQPEKPRDEITHNSSIRAMMGPLAVDQAIRQAIMHCWMMLSEEERTVKRVEEEILRLVKRAFDDMKEDAEAFGITSTDS